MHTDIWRTAMIFEAKIYLHEVTKFINSQTNNKSSMAWQQKYKYFSIKLSTILLDASYSLEKLGTKGPTCSTGVISVIYKFRLQTFRLNKLQYNIQESYANNLRCNNWWQPISCFQKQQYYTYFPPFDR